MVCKYVTKTKLRMNDNTSYTYTCCAAKVTSCVGDTAVMLWRRQSDADAAARRLQL